MRRDTYFRKVNSIRKAANRAVAPKVAKPLAKKAAPTKATFKGGRNYDPKTGVTKIPGIGIRQIDDKALTGREAVKKQRERDMLKTWKNSPSDGRGVGY
jgi:hypothetical protein